MGRLPLSLVVTLSFLCTVSDAGVVPTEGGSCFTDIQTFFKCRQNVYKDYMDNYAYHVNTNHGMSPEEDEDAMLEFHCQLIIEEQDCANALRKHRNVNNDEVVILKDIILNEIIDRTLDHLGLNDTFWDSDKCPISRAYVSRTKEEEEELDVTSFIEDKDESCGLITIKHGYCAYKTSMKMEYALTAGEDGRYDWVERIYCNYITEMNQVCGSKLRSDLLTPVETYILQHFKTKQFVAELENRSDLNWDSQKCPDVRNTQKEVLYKEEQWVKCNNRTRVLAGTTFTSPDYPGNYPANITQEYTFDVSEGRKVLVEFLVFDIEEECNGDCAFDWVKVLDEGSDGDILLGKTCASNKPEPFTSKSNKIKIIFHTDSSLEKQGWELIVKEV